MRTLFITSAGNLAGENLVTLGIGVRLRQAKNRIGFFKPIGNRPIKYERSYTDEDAIFFQKLFELKEPLNLICPVLVTDEMIDRVLKQRLKTDFAQKIKKSFDKVSLHKDTILVKGLGQFYRGACLGIPELNLVKEFNWHTIFISRFTRLAENIDMLLGAKKVLGNLLMGGIINCVPENKVSYLKKKVIPFLKHQKVNVLGIIPYQHSLEAVSIGEIRNALNGNLICGRDRKEESVGRFFFGTMDVETALRDFRRERAKVVITEAYRADILLAALETNTRCLILTNNRYPSDIILSRAEEANVPIIITSDDMIRVAEKLKALTKHLGLFTMSRVKEAVNIVHRYVNLKSILQCK